MVASLLRWGSHPIAMTRKAAPGAGQDQPGSTVQIPPQPSPLVVLASPNPAHGGLLRTFRSLRVLWQKLDYSRPEPLDIVDIARALRGGQTGEKSLAIATAMQSFIEQRNDAPVVTRAN